MRKFTYNEVKVICKNLNIELLDKKYINSYTPLNLKCSNGHIFRRTLSNLKLNTICPIYKLDKLKV